MREDLKEDYNPHAYTNPLFAGAPVTRQNRKLLIIGHARHGKDTVAEMISKHFGLKVKGSSEMAAEIFIYDALKDKYGYKTPEECFEDRVNHRQEWYELICDYNKEDPTRLAKAIMKDNDIYCGMRSSVEIEECRNQGVFDFVIGVFNPSVPSESRNSFSINLFQEADIVITNNGTLKDLEAKVVNLLGPIVADKAKSNPSVNVVDMNDKVKDDTVILAVDFDGTICEVDYPGIGREREGAKEYINKLYDEGYMIVINTCRTNAGEVKAQDMAEEFLKLRGIKYHKINENMDHLIEVYGCDTRKISADVYIDDKCLYKIPTWEEKYNIIKAKFPKAKK